MKRNPTGYFIVQLVTIFIRLIGWLLFMAGAVLMFAGLVEVLSNVQP